MGTSEADGYIYHVRAVEATANNLHTCNSVHKIRDGVYRDRCLGCGGSSEMPGSHPASFLRCSFFLPGFVLQEIQRHLPGRRATAKPALTRICLAKYARTQIHSYIEMGVHAGPFSVGAKLVSNLDASYDP